MARVLATAARMLVEVGPERLSIPDIAVAADVPRSSIYQFYPDKYALLAHLADMQMSRLSDHLRQSMQADSSPSWRVLVSRAIPEAAAFYNSNKLASVLLLEGPFGEQDRLAHHRKDRQLAQMFRALIERDPDAPNLASSPDRVAIGVELAFAVMKYGYANDRTLSSEIVVEATRAATSYLGDGR